MVNDVTGLPAFEVFNKNFTQLLQDKIVLIPDHYVPNKDVKSAEQAKAMREFAKRYKIANYFEIGRGGICHQLMIENGFVAPGRLIIGADSHTCSYGAFGCFSTGIGSTEAACAMASGKLWFKVPDTQKFVINGKLPKYSMGKDIILHIIGDIGVDGSLYKSMEYYGETIKRLSVADRISICNMAIEVGAMAGIMPPDKKVFEFLENRVKGDYKAVYADRDAVYSETFEYNAEEILPTVAQPSLPENTKLARDLNVEVDQVYIGSCTNGRIEDLRIAAKILKGKKINKNVRAIIVPASKAVYQQALNEGLLNIFLDANCYVSGPTCGACLGGYMGVLAEGEVCISTTNRNFIGRMGHPKSRVYLANPAVAAASALTGRITDPNELD
jgi:3-isopropylmalate/(R)-2-methylmalate dehydratase large subunit